LDGFGILLSWKTLRLSRIESTQGVPMNVKKTGFVLATAAAAMFAAGTVASVSYAAGVKCVGANACKGQSACKTGSSACKGQNACKGKGFTEAKDAAACTAAGGKAG
jgi:hypothetical protein